MDLTKIDLKTFIDLQASTNLDVVESSTIRWHPYYYHTIPLNNRQRFCSGSLSIKQISPKLYPLSTLKGLILANSQQPITNKTPFLLPSMVFGVFLYGPTMTL